MTNISVFQAVQANIEMNKEKIVNRYIEKSEENYKLYEHLNSIDSFIEWQIVALFYSALCHVKAYLYNKNSLDLNSINSHDDIRFYLINESQAKRIGVFRYYDILYKEGRDARYNCIKTTKERLFATLKNYQKVKELIKIN